MKPDPEPARPDDDRISLDLSTPRGRIGRATGTVGCSLLFGALMGLGIGLVTDWPVGLVAAGFFGLPLAVSAIPDAWLRTSLRDGVVSVRSVRVRSVDLRHPSKVELVVVPVRATRLVRLRVGGPPRIAVTLAAYTATGYRELEPMQLRRLADALAGGDETDVLAFAELLVAQLRALAKEEPVVTRPLYRLAAAALTGHRRVIGSDEIGPFVASLD
ncbi:MAG TPA: hypothetical protein VHV74_04940 [Pseudonocardiaceae bacterium]|nr:hypothetical protein [Pseudonocardiaceae bacterium]